MKLPFSKVLLLISLCLPGIALADIAVLVHGYQSSGNTWRNKGIVQLLANNGWNDAGHYTPVLGNIGIPGQTLSNTGKHIVTVELPSESAVEIQADLLNTYLTDMSTRFPQQKIHLIAHSAGGIVCRLALVRNSFLPVVQLITIATPHLGSRIAEMAEIASDTPIGFFVPFIGVDELNRGERLYSQLGREKENYFLFWLNRQPHPAIAYTSIVRASGSLLHGDIFVPPYSQNMSYVPAIGAQARVILTPGDHDLKFADGFLLMTLLP